jgi:hypothetical protein
LDTVLVVNTQRQLEKWLLNALPLIMDGSVFPDFHVRLLAVSECALSSLILDISTEVLIQWKENVINHLINYYQNGRVKRSLILMPASSPSHAWIVEALYPHLDHSSLPLDLLLKALQLRANISPVFTAYPLSRMEALYLYHRLAMITGILIESDIVEIGFSCSEEWQPLAYREIYELVHAVFFLTDFGNKNWESGLNSLKPYRCAIVVSLKRAAEVCLREKHLDLIGEIALALLYLDEITDTWPLLLKLSQFQLSDGSITTWHGAQGIYGCYHATLIALITFSTALNHSQKNLNN